MPLLADRPAATVRPARAIRVGAIVIAGVIAGIACGSSGDDDTAPTNTPATTLDRLVAAYPDPAVDPSSDAWAAVLADPAFATDPIAVVEFARLKPGDDARSSYNTYVDALTPAITGAGGTMLSVNDVLFPGLEGLEGYEGGVSWIASFPSLEAYVDVVLDPAVVAAAERRRDALEEAQVLAGANLLPDVVLQLGPNAPASDFPSDRVQGKDADQIVDELLRIYPSGGADPTDETLRAMVEFEGWQDQRVHFINLYQFNDDPGGGATALSEYNAAAFPVVVAHGGRPKVLANVSHHLVGPTRWDRFIFVSWPSLAVFTDLRLDPTYIEAQKDRVVSADAYGNLINIARADAPQAAPE